MLPAVRITEMTRMHVRGIYGMNVFVEMSVRMEVLVESAGFKNNRKTSTASNKYASLPVWFVTVQQISG